MPDLSGISFALVENPDGHAAGSTIMQFDVSSRPCRATYSGPNIVFGQAIVSENEMLYHALETDGRLTAGRAKVSLLAQEGHPLTMTLHWEWLTGDQSNGKSTWRQVNFGALK